MQWQYFSVNFISKYALMIIDFIINEINIELENQIIYTSYINYLMLEGLFHNEIQRKLLLR